MDAQTSRKSNLYYWLGLGLVALFASILTADAKCTIRSGDPLIKARYQDCNPKSFISYLYNDLITPYSFKCAKQVKATCQNEKCEHPATEADAKRCLDRFAEVLTSCSQQIDDAARMAKCTDTKAWPVDQILAQFVASMPKTTVAATAPASTANASITTMPTMMPTTRANNPTQASVSAKSLPRSNGPMTDAEKAEIEAANAADAEATITRTAAATEATKAAASATPITAAPNAPVSTSPTATDVTPTSTAAILDTTSPPATPAVLEETTTARAPATTAPGASNAISPANPSPELNREASPPSPAVKVEPLPGEAFRVARKPARTSQRAPRTRYPARN